MTCPFFIESDPFFLSFLGNKGILYPLLADGFVFAVSRPLLVNNIYYLSYLLDFQNGDIPFINLVF
jgi:hypothetical protein